MRLIVNATTDVLSGRSNNDPHDGQLTISVIGAGNCQDIDSAVLSELFTEIRLIDIDAEAVNFVV
jgi:hypothetical protein